jgi:hypothetical protein
MLHDQGGIHPRLFGHGSDRGAFEPFGPEQCASVGEYPFVGLPSLFPSRWVSLGHVFTLRVLTEHSL